MSELSIIEAVPDTQVFTTGKNCVVIPNGFQGDVSEIMQLAQGNNAIVPAPPDSPRGFKRVIVQINGKQTVISRSSIEILLTRKQQKPPLA